MGTGDGRQSSTVGCDCVVPVVSRRWQTLDGGMHSDHLASHRFPDVVAVEAAGDLVATLDQSTEPGRLGPRSRGRDADAIEDQLETTDRVDRRFTKDNLAGPLGADPEISQVLACARSYSTPRASPGSPLVRSTFSLTSLVLRRVLIQKMQNVLPSCPASHAALSHSFPQGFDQFIQANPSAFNQARYHPHVGQHGGMHHTRLVKDQSFQRQLHLPWRLFQMFDAL